MSETSPFTTREAVLSSLLLHACIIIVVLLFPGIFTPSPHEPSPIDPNQPIPMTFVEEPDQSEATFQLADKGDKLAGDPRPESAAPPQNDDPYSIGNTPNRFAAPPVSRPAAPNPPVPSTPPAQAEASPQERAEPGTDASGDEEAGPSVENRSASADSFYIPPTPAQDRAGRGAGSDRKGSLRETLGRMSTGLSGGDPLRFNNPVGAVSGPYGGLSFDTPGFDWGPYARKIYWVIWTNWTQGWPPAAWAGLKGTVTVHFRIHRDGTISDVQVVTPSGTVAFDTCATVALEASSPLPPLPSDFNGESEGITARFLYNMDSAGD